MNMQIQWFPGHMYKAGKEIKKALPSVDLVIEVLDARIPFSSENPMLASIRVDKPCIKIFNKSDLADEELTTQWQSHLEQEQGVKTLALSTIDPGKFHQLPDLCRKIIPEKAGTPRGIHAMIMGIPNVGKSTLINTLVGKTIAKTGNEPAVTKHQQRIKLADDITLFDTPGMLWPNVENKNSGYRLATTGAIRDTAMNYDDIAFFAAEYLLQVYPARLLDRYQLDELPQSELEFLELVGAKRGCLRAGGMVDLDKVSKIFLTEIRSGKLGRLSFETPEMMQTELIELEQIRAEKAAKKESRKARRYKRRG